MAKQQGINRCKQHAVRALQALVVGDGFQLAVVLGVVSTLALALSGFPAHATTGVNLGAPSAEELPSMAIEHRINLTQAIDMVMKTELGQALKTDIVELTNQGKIRLTTLNAVHYGESGEGCVIHEGQYYYEGYFIALNQKLNIPELASTLVHETDHYRQIKRIYKERPAEPVSIASLEKSAFALQLSFIEALEKQGLTERKALFVNRAIEVFDVMYAAQVAKQEPSVQHDRDLRYKLMILGYPLKELERTLLVKDVLQCQGQVAQGSPSKLQDTPTF